MPPRAAARHAAHGRHRWQLEGGRGHAAGKLEARLPVRAELPRRMGAEGAANIIFRKEIEATEDKVAKRAEKIEEYKESFANPYRAAQRGFVDRVILPEETRPALYQALLMTESKSELRPKRKHGILPN